MQTKMDTSVDNIFEKIKQSEKEAQNRKSALNELKQCIFTIQEKIKMNERDCADLQKDFNEKLRELSENDYKVRVEDIQAEIYRQEKQQLEQEVEELKAKQVELSFILDEAKLKLCRDIDSVTMCYGFSVKDRQLREEKHEEELTRLKEEEESLSNGIQEYTAKKVEVDSLLKQQLDLQLQFKDIEDEKNRLQCELDVETEKTLHMKTDHQLTRDRLDNNVVFIQQEVMREKETASNLEVKCCNLQKELQYLQQKDWQKRVQTRRNPQQESSNVENRGQVATTVHMTVSGPYLLGGDLETVFSDSEEFTDCDIISQMEDQSSDKPFVSHQEKSQSSDEHGVTYNQMEKQSADQHCVSNRKDIQSLDVPFVSSQKEGQSSGQPCVSYQKGQRSDQPSKANQMECQSLDQPNNTHLHMIHKRIFQPKEKQNLN